MNSSVFSLLLATFALFRVATAGGDCDVDGYVYNSVYQTCVKAYTSPLPFNDAEDVCIADGGNLLSIHSAMEDQAVFDIIDYPVTWVGLMYDFSHSWFEWTDGSEVDYNPLASIPVNYGCTTLTKNSAGGLPLWYDSSCDNVNAPFICALPSKGLTQQTWMPSGGMETSQSDGWTDMSMVSMASSDMPMGSSDMPTMETMQPTWAPKTTTSRATRLMTTTTPTTTTTTTTTQRPPQTTSTQGPPGKCPAGWLTSAARQNTCYYVYDAAVVDYFNALRFCQNLHANSHVLVIHNGFENSEVRDLITTSTVWLGLDSGSGTWAWSDGETSSYTNWATGQPSSDNSCSVLNRSTGKWSTVDCDSRLPLICQLYF